MNRINLNPGAPVLDARELEQLLDLYLADMALRVSPISVTNYRYALQTFRHWWQAHGPRLKWRLSKRDLQHYARDLGTMRSQYDRPLSLRTRRNCLVRLRQALRWAAVNEYTGIDCSLWVPSIPGTPPEKHAAPTHTLPKLMEAALQRRNPARDSAILAVLIGTGMRRAECAALNVEDVHFALSGGGQIEIRRGKGGKPRSVVFGETTSLYLAVYLEELAEDSGPLWRNPSGDRLGAHAIYDMVRTVVKLAGLEQYIAGPHDFRRLFATTWNRNRRGLSAAAPLSKQLGHSTTQMTLQYILPDIGDVAREYRDPFDSANETDDA